MKRQLRGILLLMILVILGSTAVFAGQASEYVIDEIGATVHLPDGLMSYTRTSGIDTNVEKALGITDDYKEHLIQDMETKNIYMKAFDANVNYEISLESVESTREPFSSMSDEEILKLVDEGLDGTLTEYGLEVNTKDVFTENERKYAVVGFSDSTSDCFLYATVQHHQAYYFYIKVLNGKLTDAHKALIKQIAGGAEFVDKIIAVTTASAGADNSANTAVQDNSRDNGFITRIVKVAKIIFIVVIAAVVLLLIMKALSGKKIGRQVNYVTRKDAAYVERLNRIMGDSNNKNESDVNY